MVTNETAKESTMSRAHRRGNREDKKPKQPKKVVPVSTTGFLSTVKPAAEQVKKR